MSEQNKQSASPEEVLATAKNKFRVVFLDNDTALQVVQTKLNSKSVDK